MSFGPNIPSERQWIGLCISLGWKLRDISGLRRLYRKVHPLRVKPIRGFYAVRYGSHVLPEQFSSPDAAERWALENYKGTREGWEIVNV